jgi:hypothetical protein
MQTEKESKPARVAVSLLIAADVARVVDAEAAAEGLSRSDVIRRALLWHIARRREEAAAPMPAA